VRGSRDDGVSRGGKWGTGMAAGHFKGARRQGRGERGGLIGGHVVGGTGKGGAWRDGRVAGSNPGTAVAGGRWHQRATWVCVHGMGRWEAARWGLGTGSNVFQLL
jgi:hypothetical protein